MAAKLKFLSLTAFLPWLFAVTRYHEIFMHVEVPWTSRNRVFHVGAQKASLTSRFIAGRCPTCRRHWSAPTNPNSTGYRYLALAVVFRDETAREYFRIRLATLWSTADCGNACIVSVSFIICSVFDFGSGYLAPACLLVGFAENMARVCTAQNLRRIAETWRV